MQIVIIVTIVFFVLTLAGTWLARRSAYTWADNEKAMGPDGVRADVPQASGTSNASAAPTGPVVRGSPTRAASRPNQVVITGFDSPTND